MCTILIIDDEISQQDLFIEYLESEGWFVGKARDFTEAIQALKRQAWDVVLLDLRMPGPKIKGSLRQFAGVQLLTAIRSKQFENIGVPANQAVVVMTAVVNEAITDLVETLRPDALYFKENDLLVLMDKLYLLAGKRRAS